MELYADPLGEHPTEIKAMTACNTPTDQKGPVTYSAQIAATRAANDYTPRIVPHRPGVAVPLEAGQILWQR